MSKITELEKEVARLQAALEAKQETVDILREILVQEQPNPFGLGQIPSVRPTETAKPWTSDPQTWAQGGVNITSNGTWQVRDIPSVSDQTQYYGNTLDKPSGWDNNILETKQKKPCWTANSDRDFESLHKD